MSEIATNEPRQHEDDVDDEVQASGQQEGHESAEAEQPTEEPAGRFMVLQKQTNGTYRVEASGLKDTAKSMSVARQLQFPDGGLIVKVHKEIRIAQRPVLEFN